MKHTPGPWEWSEEGNYVFRIYTADDPIIAQIDCGYSPFVEEEDRANITVMAAAPRMLAALEALLADYESWLDYESQNMDDEELDRVNTVCDEARAALAQAKGE